MEELARKRCARCREEKPSSDFARKYGSILQPYCRACHAVYKQEHYAKHRTKYIQQARQRRVAILKEIRELKNCPCIDCGIKYPYYVMDFDHREGEEKIADINDLVIKQGKGIKAVLVEIAKCDLVCANCHRERSYQRLKGKMNQANATELLL